MEQREDQDISLQYNSVKLLVPSEIFALVKKIAISYKKPDVIVEVEYKS